MEESPIEITLTVQLALTIDPTEQYPLAVISEVVLAKQNITSILVEALVECLNERLVENFCGKNTSTATEPRFQRLRDVYSLGGDYRRRAHVFVGLRRRHSRQRR